VNVARALDGLVRRARPGGRSAVQIRLYDLRGHARTLDPEREPGRGIAAAAEAMLSARSAPEPRSERESRS
jgi:hypothetical protein